jgi:Protein of unknown function (DUF3352)
LIKSPAVNDLLDPMLKLAKPPKEFKTIVKWLNAHADVLSGSRIMIATLNSRPNVPSILVAVEFSSPEEAKKFYPELRDFIPTLLPSPTPTPTPTPTTSPSPALQSSAVQSNESAIEYRSIKVLPTDNVDQTGPAPPPYQISRAGSLVFLSDVAFKVADLKPRDSKALEEDQNFTLARSRFASESVFLYFDLKSILKEAQERQEKFEEERKKAEEAAANAPTPEEPAQITESESEVATEAEEMGDEASVDEEMPSPSPEPTVETITTESGQTGTLSGSPQSGAAIDDFSLPFLLFGGMGMGQAHYPEGIGAGIVFEGDAYVARVLLVNGAGTAGDSIPFFPQFVSGPPIVPASPSIFPADAGVFVTASLDYQQIYERILSIISAAAALRSTYGQPVSDKPPESPFAVYESKLGMKIKADLLPLFGNELALVLLQNQNQGPGDATKQPAQTNKPGTEATATPVNAGPNPVVAISIKDRDAVAKLMPKLIESFGLKGAQALAQTERRGSTEIVSYAGVFAYAFIDNFLVIAADPRDTRRVVDSYLNNETLASSSNYRNSIRWQPRQVLGQVYMAPGLVEQFTTGKPVARDKFHDYLARVNPAIDPLTYSLTNDGVGHLHELHMPKNLLQLLVAGLSAEIGDEPIRTNEIMARSALWQILGSQRSFRTSEARYGSLEELVAKDLVNKDIENHGYKIELSVSSDKFEATAVPLEYGITGRLSYFMDESGVIRAADHGGGPATVADAPIDH